MSFIPDSIYAQVLQQLPIICVDVVIVLDNKCLLLLRDNEPAKNTYWFPGGRIYKNETIVNAAIRKSKEETNLECSFVNIISIEESIFKKNENMLTDIHTVNVCCLMKPRDMHSLKLDQLHKGYLWIDRIDPSYHSAVKNPLLKLGFSI